MNNIEFTTKLHAPDIEPGLRHPHIIEVFDSLKAGEFMELSNDHNPKPLHDQFMMERKDAFSWEYLQEGPALWRVAIGKK